MTEPSTGSTLGRMSDCGLEDFQHAISVASKAQPKYYQETTAAARGAFLRSWSEHILANANDCELPKICRYLHISCSSF